MSSKRFLVVFAPIFVFAGISFVVYAQSDSFLNSENIFDTLSVDLKVNSSDGPVEIATGGRITLSWISEGATRCRGVWSKSDLKLSGTATGKINKSVAIKIACINEDGDRVDDSVTVNVQNVSLQATPSTQPVLPVQPATQQFSQTVRKSVIPQTTLARDVINSPGVVFPSSYPIRELVLDTLGNPVQAAQYDVEREGKLNEFSGGGIVKTWKVKYEKKGHARFVCDPPILNVSFDKKDSKGNKRELFTGISTYPGRPQLQYQKIRMVPLCEAEQYYNPSTNLYAGFGGKIDAQLREYFALTALRAAGAPAVDVVGFANVSFVSPDAQYNNKTFRYMLLQRDNEQDDEFPFTEQFNLESTLIEDGKWNAQVWSSANEGNYTIFGDLLYKWNSAGADTKPVSLRRDPDDMLKGFLIAKLIQDGDRAILHNEDYGKVKNADVWRTITYGFDWNLYECNISNFLDALKSNMEWNIKSLLSDQQQIYKSAYQRVASSLFFNSDILSTLHKNIARFPFQDSGGKELLNDYLDMAFYRFGSYFQSSEFAAFTGVPADNTIKPIPFSSVSMFETAKNNFNERCWLNTSPSDSGAKAEVSSARLQLLSVKGQGKEGEEAVEYPYLQANFAVTITASKNQDVVINKSSAFKVTFVGPNLEKMEVGSEVYARPVEIAETVGPSWTIPAGVIAHFSVSFRYDLPRLTDNAETQVVEGKGGAPWETFGRQNGEYSAFISTITLAGNALPITPRTYSTNVVAINRSNNKPLSVNCSAFSPSSIPIGREVKWVASVEGGEGKYTYLWSGTDGLEGNATTTTKKYTTTGKKSATVIVTRENESKSASCGGVNVESQSPATVSFLESFFHKGKKIFAGKPDQILGAFYASVKKEGQVFPAPSILVRNLYFKILDTPITNVSIIEEGVEKIPISGKVVYTSPREASIVFEEPIEIKDGSIYVVRGTVDKSIAVGTQITTFLVYFDASPGIKSKDMNLPVVSAPVTIVAPESALNISENQFASPFLSGVQDLFSRLFGNK
jgi:hypothetical protein